MKRMNLLLSNNCRVILFLSLLLIPTHFLATTVFSADVTLVALGADTKSDLGGYRLYYGTSSGVYTTMVDVGNVTAYTVSNLSQGEIYYFAVTAYDAGGNESAFSEEIVTNPSLINTDGKSISGAVTVRIRNITNDNFRPKIQKL